MTRFTLRIGKGRLGFFYHEWVFVRCFWEGLMCSYRIELGL